MYLKEFRKQVLDNPLILQILNAFYDGVSVLDSKLNFLYVNNAHKKITGLTDEDYSHDVYSLLKDGKTKVKVSAAAIALETKCKYTTLVKGRHGDRILITATPILNEHDEVIYLVVNLRSLTGLNYLGYELEMKEKQQRALSPLTYNDFKFRKIREQLDNAGFPDFVVASPPMLEMMETIIRLAQYDTTVLLEGETGVGKTCIAKIIHKFSQRRSDVFVDVNVGSVPVSLFESTFFGYEGGTFTGGQKEGKIGLVESANGGTLFLDEIENLPPEVQGKILKLIDEKKYYKVGGNKILTADVKLIAGSNASLHKLSKEGKFRTDLFYRFNELNFVVPPLRERKEDIPLLTDHFQKRLYRKYGIEKKIEKEAMDFLSSYEFKGNARELKNIMERIYLKETSHVIDRNSVEKHVKYEDDHHSSMSMDHIKSSDEKNEASKKAVEPQLETYYYRVGLKRMKEELVRRDKERIIQLYMKYKSTYKVAKEMNISQPTVWRKLKRHLREDKKGTDH